MNDDEKETETETADEPTPPYEEPPGVRRLKEIGFIEEPLEQ